MIWPFTPGYRDFRQGCFLLRTTILPRHSWFMRRGKVDTVGAVHHMFFPHLARNPDGKVRYLMLFYPLDLQKSILPVWTRFPHTV